MNLHRPFYSQLWPSPRVSPLSPCAIVSTIYTTASHLSPGRTRRGRLSLHVHNLLTLAEASKAEGEEGRETGGWRKFVTQT